MKKTKRLGSVYSSINELVQLRRWEKGVAGAWDQSTTMLELLKEGGNRGLGPGYSLFQAPFKN